MIKKASLQNVFKGRNAVILSTIWISVYLLVTFILTGAVTSNNVLNMFVGLTFVLVLSILFKNGW